MSENNIINEDELWSQMNGEAPKSEPKSEPVAEVKPPRSPRPLPPRAASTASSWPAWPVWPPFPWPLPWSFPA